MAHPKTCIIHGKSLTPTDPSPRLGREHAELWCGYMGMHNDWTRRFDPHPVEHCKHYPDGIKGRRADVWEYYKTLPPFITSTGAQGMKDVGRPVYLLDAIPDVPASCTYPLDFVRHKLGKEPCKRFTCTVDMQIALALAEDFQHIILHNIGLITDAWETTALNPEWADKHKGILFWIGVAEFYGEYEPVKVTVEGPSIFSVPEKTYGYETCGRDFGVAQRRYFTNKRGPK